jgi:hypothetical protein
MSLSDANSKRSRVLFVYYTYTQQSRRVVEAMTDVLRERGCDVRQARIEFTDSRWAERFSRLPLRHAYRDILGMLPAQLRGATGEIQIPDEAREGDYDLICVGSPTWFSSRACRSARSCSPRRRGGCWTGSGSLPLWSAGGTGAST